MIGGTGAFSVTKSTVDANGLTGARLLVFELTGLTVTSTFGVSLAVDSLKVATLQPSAAAVIAGDTRKWSALKIDGAGGSLLLGGALTATVTNVDVEVNSASGALGATHATPIDWTTVTGSGITTADPGVPPRGHDRQSLSIADVISGAGKFSVTKSTVDRRGPDQRARCWCFNAHTT